MHLSSSSFVALGLLSSLATAISTAQIESVFGQGTQGLTGSSTTLPNFALSIVTNSTHALVTFNSTSTAPASVGWMGVGVGTAMANADFLVVWPTPAASYTSGPGWTISHRTTTGENEPQVASTDASLATNTFYTVVESLSSKPTDSYTSVSVLRLLTFPTGYPALSRANSGNLVRTGSNNFIYASSSVAPASADQGAGLTQHNQAHARTSLDLSQAVTIAAAAGTSSAAGASATKPAAGGATTTGAGPQQTSNSNAGGGLAFESSGRTKHDMILIAHGVTAGLATMILMPSAILIARYFRTTRWFPLHVAFNSLAVILMIVAFGTAVYVTGGGFSDATHYSVGLAIFIIILVQAGLGYGAHLTRRPDLASGARLPTLTGKSTVRHVHNLLGLALIALAYYNVHEGFERWTLDSDAATKVPKAVTVVYWILLGVGAGLYVLGWVFEGLGKSNHQALRSDENLPTSHMTSAETHRH
ncbi:BZ3500_MvSof-1268-A1-R1_Chr4-1g06740 [Microbotryum saponariae]|uniref:BZ3500_MvSof-1268-A1-R1_Chr4-1g06740 protein n=1 Tax=Microbotryum saponariae TaxID=289078 RepID=A0A2X0MB34_9BASI|nr:BZ3500_MvSof-1268-A1-R1_Chr4-1g06740 [Microbotryum saponariae]SDA06405.1 BZ3501_MvSof-1269-A2-R1_Chr4-1g06450 [Microbotryum saponariae]